MHHDRSRWLRQGDARDHPAGGLLPGTKVAVATPDELAATLDADGTLDALPFMPEMLKACGGVFTVAMRAERACARGLAPGENPLRQLTGCVVLEGLRCDGSAHDGCQLGCALLWKEAWLRPLGAGEPELPAPALADPAPLRLRTRREGSPASIFCQATELVRATHQGPSRWSPRPYLRLLSLRTLTPGQLAGMLTRSALARLRSAARALRSPRRWPAGEDAVDLKPGNRVEVKPAPLIRATLDPAGRHRGLGFGADMLVYCGRRYRVRDRVRVLVQEETGQLRSVRGTVTLEGTDCRRHMGCARQMPYLWREEWLRRVPAEQAEPVPSPRRRGYRAVKRALDVAGAICGLLLLSPLLASVALAVRLSSPGPVLFRQERVGRHGRPFTLLKFRSMDAVPGPAITARGDLRVTRVGGVLRRWKLDELPQLWNVLVGEMSLVGPRPELARFVRLFPAEYERVLSVRPGLTDFAALEFRDEEALLSDVASAETTYAAVVLPAKLPLYRRYLEEMSLVTDLRLFLKTLAAVLR